MANLINRMFSGVVLNQNQSAHEVAGTTTHYQTFSLPLNYVRDDGAVPLLTGFQIYSDVADVSNQITWTIDYRPAYGPWINLASGVSTGAPAAGTEVWFTCLADQPIEISLPMVSGQFRFGVTSSTVSFHFASPSPLSGAAVYQSDGTTAYQYSGQGTCFAFRILAGVADSGTDILGNPYRSMVAQNSGSGAAIGSGADDYWLSGPQPSQFAVVSRYFDMRDASDNPRVIDRVLLDPVTPNVWAHVYYSNDGSPGTDSHSWEERIWTPVPQSYKMVRRDTFVFPEPITAKYVKIEFSHLQARGYTPNTFQRKLSYKKHPRWVLDYFLLATEAARPSGSASFVANSKDVVYDAYSLAFSYFKDDLIQGPNPPLALSPEEQVKLSQVITTSAADQVDSQTAARINLALQPYLREPRTLNLARGLLGDVALNAIAQINTYPVESAASPTSFDPAVSSIDREAVIFEQTFPVMFFYVACRHRYREVTASLQNGRAYFVGLKEVVFTRERFEVDSDTPFYVETMGDYVNAERNDFIAGDIPTVNV